MQQKIYIDKIRHIINARDYSIKFQSPNDYRLAAAIALIEFHDNQPHIVFIKRTRHFLKGGREAAHSGQIAFPGGKLESGETPIEAALREAEEEVQMHTESIQVVGKLGEFTTHVSGYLTHIFLAFAENNQKFIRDEAEVAGIFRVPVDVLLKQHDSLLEADNYENVLALHYHWSDDKQQKDICIWGMTGRATWCLLEVLKQVEFI